MHYENPTYSVFDRVTRETRILAEYEIIDELLKLINDNRRIINEIKRR